MKVGWKDWNKNQTRRQGGLNESWILGKGRIQLTPAVSPLGELQGMMPTNSSPVNAWDIVFLRGLRHVRHTHLLITLVNGFEKASCHIAPYLKSNYKNTSICQLHLSTALFHTMKVNCKLSCQASMDQNQKGTQRRIYMFCKIVNPFLNFCLQKKEFVLTAAYSMMTYCIRSNT